MKLETPHVPSPTSQVLRVVEDWVKIARLESGNGVSPLKQSRDGSATLRGLGTRDMGRAGKAPSFSQCGQRCPSAQPVNRSPGQSVRNGPSGSAQPRPPDPWMTVGEWQRRLAVETEPRRLCHLLRGLGTWDVQGKPRHSVNAVNVVHPLNRSTGQSVNQSIRQPVKNVCNGSAQPRPPAYGLALKMEGEAVLSRRDRKKCALPCGSPGSACANTPTVGRRFALPSGRCRSLFGEAGDHQFFD